MKFTNSVNNDKRIEFLFAEHLKKISLKSNVNFIDGRKVIDPSFPGNYSPYGEHLSPEGYEKISKQFLNY